MPTGRWCSGNSHKGAGRFLFLHEDINRIHLYMRIIPLSEGRFTVDKSKQFIPYEAEEHELQDRPTGSLLVEIQPFVLVTAEDVLLLDAGLGFHREGKLQLHHNLLHHGIQPGDVTKILMTHLHKDHAGGLFQQSGEGKPHLSFPNAHIYIQQQELSYALTQASASYHRDLLCLLQEHPQVVLLEGDGVLNGFIKYQLTGAHSPFHQVFWIVDGGVTAFFGGDDAPQLQQMKSRFIAKYDFDGKKCMALRRQWWEAGTAEGWTFLFYHDSKSPVYPDPAY